jgi:hypothetical protein
VRSGGRCCRGLLIGGAAQQSGAVTDRDATVQEGLTSALAAVWSSADVQKARLQRPLALGASEALSMEDAPHRLGSRSAERLLAHKAARYSSAERVAVHTW